MKGWKVLFAAAALCIPVAARAQEGGAPAGPSAPPPAAPKEGAPAKHENHVTPAAQAAFDKMKKITYTPVLGGLKDLSGAVKLEMEAGPGGGGPGGGPEGGEGKGGRAGMMGKLGLTFAVNFKAPDDLSVEWKDLPGGGGGESEKGGGMMSRMRERMSHAMSGGIARMLHTMITGFAPAGDSEYDADVKVVDGVTKVVITSYLKGVEVSTNELTLDANGLPVSGVVTSKAPEGPPAGAPGGRGPGMRNGGGKGPDGRNSINFTYSKEGELFRLDKMTFDPQGTPTESTLKYADAGSFKVAYAWEMAGPMGAKFAVKFSELTVNGKVVTLPDAAPAAPGDAKPGDAKPDAKPADAKAAGKPGGNAAGMKEKDEDDEKDEKDEDDEKGEGKEKK
jgi:hypothetical protein